VPLNAQAQSGTLFKSGDNRLQFLFRLGGEAVFAGFKGDAVYILAPAEDIADQGEGGCGYFAE